MSILSRAAPRRQSTTAAAVIDSNGAVMRVYRKHHLPMSSLFNKKFYFRPGNRGFPVFDMPEGRIVASIN